MGPDTSGSPERSHTIVVVDDHQIFRQGVLLNLKLEPDFEVVGECGTGEEALELVRALRPELVVMDINLPQMNGIQVTRQLSAERVPSRIVMLTAYDDIEQAIHALRAGASAYCAKEIPSENLVDVIRHVLSGRFVVRDHVFDAEGIAAWIEQGVESRAAPYYLDTGDAMSPLSAREMEILHFVTSGLSNKQIAKTLRISHQTVKNHMTAILRKLAVEDRTQAAVFALKRGWVRLTDDNSRSKPGA